MSIITFEQAMHFGDEQNRRNEQEQKEKLEEFLTSDHELTDVRDLIFYSEKTNKSVDFLVRNAENLNPLMKVYFVNGGDIDEAFNIDFHYRSIQNQKQRLIHRNDKDTLYNWEVYEYCGQYFEQLNEEERQTIIEDFDNGTMQSYFDELLNINI